MSLDSSERARLGRLLDLIDAVKLTLEGVPVTLDTVQTRIRKLGSERQAERVVKGMYETARSLGFEAKRRPFMVDSDGHVVFLSADEPVFAGGHQWALQFSRPTDLLDATQAEFDALMTEPGAPTPKKAFSVASPSVERRRAAQRALRKTYREHGLCVACKGQAFKAGLCETHWEQHKRLVAEYRRRHKELGLCAYCNRRLFKSGYCEDHYEAIRERIKQLQQERREEGLCVVAGCGDDAFKGSLCQRHYVAAEERKKEFRRLHKEQGLCSECNEPAFSGGLCVVHNEKHRKSQSRRKKELVALGRCRECGEPSGGRSYCPKHEAEHAARQKQRYDTNRAAGLCGLCGGVPPKGKALCESCRADQAASAQRVVAKRDEAGLCRKCGKREPVAGKTRCQACIENQKERGRRHYEKLKASPLCVVCHDRPKVEGKTYCAECLEAARLKQAARRKMSNPNEEDDMSRRPRDSITFWHGTPRKKLAAVLRSGLTPSEGWGGAGTFGVYLAGSPEGALYWAKIAFQLAAGEKMEVERFDRKYGDRVGELLAVVSVTIPPEAIANLRADMEQAEDVGFEGEPEDWEASLEEIGDVMYDGEIPADWVREVELPS